jgi:thiamine-monophosphate kinase
MPPRDEFATLAGLGEAGLIARLAAFRPVRTDVVRGIGDDCAVIREPDGSALLVTTDALIEGVHFRRDWSSAASIGHKALAVNLSDVAAMGGVPVAAFLAFSAPSDLPVTWLDDFAVGLRDLASRCGVDLLGGDTTGSPGPLALCLTVLGRAPMGAVRYRGGARPGDRVAVSGTLGDASLAVRLLHEGRPCPASLRRRLEWPEPRLALGRGLGAHVGCTALMDLSDGLATDLPRMARASGVGVRVDVDRVPLSADLVAACDGDRARALEWALSGGDDYELLAACRPEAETADGLTVIGEFAEGAEVTWVDGQGRVVRPPRRGFAHFGEGA